MAVKGKVKAQAKKSVQEPRRELTFGLWEEELGKLTSWLREHDKKCKYAKPENCGAVGGRLTYSFVPTSIGVIIKVRCACGEEVDVTDYNIW